MALALHQPISTNALSTNVSQSPVGAHILLVYCSVPPPSLPMSADCFVVHTHGCWHHALCIHWVNRSTTEIAIHPFIRGSRADFTFLPIFHRNEWRFKSLMTSPEINHQRGRKCVWRYEEIVHTRQYKKGRKKENKTVHTGHKWHSF